ncbi:MAG: DNA repair ATPase, partial [Flavitalea sp.]
MADKTLDSGTYEIIRNRLNEQRTDLAARLAKLNAARHEIFAANGFELIANQRITTENHGEARGILALGNLCIFGYNVHFGLRENIKLSDVFSVYKFYNDHFEPQPLTLINDENFVADFTNLYKYYRDSIFAKFYTTSNYLYMIFQTSKNPEDKKAFKWLIKNDQLAYVDDRSVHEVRKAAQHDFDWNKTTLEDRRLGVHPHISILDKVFIEAIGGDITFKIENNTATGRGIYHEPVLNRDQQLDDADYYYADLGNLIAIKIRPYQEEERSYIFNIRTREVKPIRSLLDAGILLPDNQGVIFPNGYYLQNGDFKVFESDLSGLEFIKSIASPNGEDIFYVFYQVRSNTYVLMSYNIIVQSVETPIICNGFTLFDDGKLIYFRTEQEAVRHHQVQIWQTPYTAVLQENAEMRDNVLYKIGNKDIVSAMSESQEIIQLLSKEDSYSRLYEDIQKKATDLLDAYFWIRDPATFDLAAPLALIKDIANTAIDEFAKVQAQRQHARESLATMQKRVDQLVVDIRNEVIISLDQLVQLLANTRKMQGAVIDLGNVKYIDAASIQSLKETLDQYNVTLSQDTINFLLKDQALAPYEQKVADQKAKVSSVTKAIDAQAIEESVKGIAGELEMLIDILNSLKIEDTTQSTSIIEKISLIFASLNEVKADLVRTLNNLRSKEATSEFHAQLTLLEQGIVSFLDLSTTPAKCEDYFTKVSVQLEELESKFADFPDFVLKLADKRDEIIKAFNGKNEMLIANINKKTTSLEQVGLRVLKNIGNKAGSFDNKEDIYAFFSSDLMIGKVRSLAADLAELGDVAKAENLENLLKVSQEVALRNLKDKTDLFADGQNIISLGDYKFVVNKQVLDLGIIKRDDRLFYHLVGTSFYKEVKAETLYKYRLSWEQELISENNEIYRGEYLAFQALNAMIESKDRSNFDYKGFINSKVERDYAAGYLKGVH